MDYSKNRKPWVITEVPGAFVFDLRTVLTDTRARRLFDDEAEIKFIEEVVFEDEIWEQHEVGMPCSIVIAKLSEKYPQYRYLYDRLVYKYVNMLAINDDIVNLAMQLKYQGYHVSFIGNLAEQSVSELMWRYPQLQRFDGCTFSGYVGLRKPNGSIFNYHAKEFHLIPESTCLIDAHKESILNARDCCWNTSSYTNIFNLEKAIAEKIDHDVKSMALPQCRICREEVRKQESKDSCLNFLKKKENENGN
jgi:2-haloacid dehalogenase